MASLAGLRVTSRMPSAASAMPGQASGGMGSRRISSAMIAVQGGTRKNSADTREAAMDALRGDGYTIISVNEVGGLNKDVKLTVFEKKPTPRDLAVFCRQFVAILDAGVPAVQALEMLAEQTENKMLASALADCKTTIGFPVLGSKPFSCASFIINVSLGLSCG